MFTHLLSKSELRHRSDARFRFTDDGFLSSNTTGILSLWSFPGNGLLFVRFLIQARDNDCDTGLLLDAHAEIM